MTSIQVELYKVETFVEGECKVDVLSFQKQTCLQQRKMYISFFEAASEDL